MENNDNYRATIRGTDISATFQASNYSHAKNKASWVFASRKDTRDKMDALKIVLYQTDIEAI